MFKNKKKCSILALLSLFIWGVTFYTDTRLFSSDGLNMNCLPIDTAAVPFMHIMTKLFALAAIFLFLNFLTYAYNKPFLIFPVILFFVLYMVGLLLSYPGYFMNDDPIIFSYATRYYPVYWHNYLTSLFYMVGMSLFSASCGPIILSDLLFALTYGYIFYETHKLFTTRLHYLILLLGVLPCTLLAALMPFRPCLYTSFHLFFFAWLTFQYLKKITPSLPTLFGIAFLSALLAFWRSEGILLLVFAPVLLVLAFEKRIHKGQLITFLIAMLAFFTIIKIPQYLGESKYYGSDYLIISTTRPLSVIVHRDQTYNGAAEDLTDIKAVTDFGYLHNDSLSCSSYNRYNNDNNEGRYTQTGATKAEQNAYLKSAARLITHNLDLYFGERLQLFCITNGYFNYPTGIVLDLVPVASSDFHLYEHDNAYGWEILDAFKRIEIDSQDGYSLFLFHYGGESYVPVLVVLLAGTIGCLFKKHWFLFTCGLSLLSREVIIFLTAPTSFIQYNYPTMLTVAFLALITAVRWRQQQLDIKSLPEPKYK